MRNVVNDYRWSTTKSIGVLFNIVVRIIIFNVDGGVVFEVSFLKAYNCWAVFCNKLQFRVIDPCSYDVPLDYFIHLVKIFGIFYVEFCLLEFYFQSPFLQIWCDYWGGLCLTNSFKWFFFLNGNIFHLIFIYIFVNNLRSDQWPLSVFFCLFSRFSSVLVLMFTLVFIQGLLCLLLNLSVFLLVFDIYRLKCYPGVVDLLFVLH